VVGPFEGDKAARVARGPEDLACIRDADRVVGGRMHDKQRPAQGADPLAQIRGAYVLDEVPPERECLAADQERRFTFSEDAFDEGVVVVFNVGRLVWRADAHDGAHTVDQVGSGDDGGTTEGVPDE
jgi:hypothetical protein